MKYSIAAASTLAAMAMAVKPEFLNTSFDVAEGEPFTLEFSGCETGCTVTLQTGSQDDLKDVKELSTGATGGSLTVTLEDVPTGSYNFKITNNESGEENYSIVFDYDGAAATTSSSAPTTSMPESTTTVVSTTTEMSSTSTSTTMSTTTMSSASSSTSASDSASSTASEESSTTSAETVPTSPPDSAAGRLASSVSLLIGAVAAMVMFA